MPKQQTDPEFEKWYKKAAPKWTSVHMTTLKLWLDWAFTAGRLVEAERARLELKQLARKKSKQKKEKSHA